MFSKHMKAFGKQEVYVIVLINSRSNTWIFFGGGGGGGGWSVYTLSSDKEVLPCNIPRV